ncbi:hypothetical protein TNCV_1402431 [Trichonephila clavipes]|nr:hypothetical protein TNCV_1402431 [Trichonephila clavipes]
MDHEILNHGQVTWTTLELAPLSTNYRTTPTEGRFSSRQIYGAYRCSARRKVTSSIRCWPTSTLDASNHTTWHRVIRHSDGLLSYFLPNLLKLLGQVINIPRYTQSPFLDIADMLDWGDIWLVNEVFEKAAKDSS